MDLWECVCASSVCLLDIIASRCMYSQSHACPCVVSLSGFCSSKFQDDHALLQLHRTYFHLQPAVKQINVKQLLLYGFEYLLLSARLFTLSQSI